MRALVRLITVVAVAATALLVPSVGDAPDSTASAADTRLFDAGNIISDAVFFDALSMDGTAVQRFLDAKGANCTTGEMPCLKNYRQDTATQVRDAYCAGYQGAPQETAAAIIAKVGASCGISPRALLVLLQKEQSLVTRTAPTVYAYRNATGFACPDTASCNPVFSGFVSQVYFAARQYQRYRIDAKSFRYKAGRINTIQWHPDRACGTTDVFIANQATAGLYNYTPYRPNPAALNAGYAAVPKSDPASACAAYGNRNFWNYFTDWFGSTQSPGGTAILDLYTANGGSSGPLGQATSGIACGLVGGGCFQHYGSASIYWSPATGAHVTSDSIRWRWGALGWEKSALGYPTTDTSCGLVKGGCFQFFQGGSLYAMGKTIGPFVVRGAIRDAWAATGWEGGPLGYPLTDEACGLAGGGCFNLFQNGSIYWSPATGARVVSAGPIRDRWAALGSEAGPLGYPIIGTFCGLTGGTGCFQQFQGGSLYWTAATGAHVVRGAIRDQWGALGWEGGPLGYPIGDEVCGLVNRGCFTQFQNGSIYFSPATGPHSVTGVLYGLWASRGWERGSAGYPVSDTVCGLPGGGCQQLFQGGTLVAASSTSGGLLHGNHLQRWTNLGAVKSALGYPTGDQWCGLRAGGCFQTFAKGSLYSTPATGPLAVTGDIYSRWAALSWERGPLGYPRNDTSCGLVGNGCFSHFDGGSLYWTQATGAHVVRGAIRDRWASLGWEGSAVGYPTSDENCGLVGSGCFNLFQNGSIYWSPATGAASVSGAIRDAWAARGWEAGGLGYPVEEPRKVTGGVSQRFQRGTLTYSTQTGTVTVS